MFESLRDLPAAAWRAVAKWTLVVAGSSVVCSVAAAHAMLSTFSNGLDGPGLIASIVIPLCFGVPMSFWHLVRLQQLRIANKKLEELASTDWLTTCLNRRAFTHRVTDHLGGEEDGGAFLVVDADHFKTINDQYGHDRGDEVLQLIARTIKENVRDCDLVGRIGGEEFGVFLKGASYDSALRVAERIRIAIQTAAIESDGGELPLSVSVGGACYRHEISFTELFRIADQRLYGAKQSGRNRVEMVSADNEDVVVLGAAAA